MPKDVNLRLVNTAVVFTSATAADIGDEKDTEGGFYALVRVYFGAMTGTSPTLVLSVLCSIDGGTTDFPIAVFPTLVGTDDNIEIARPVYIPQPASGQTVTKVKLNGICTGTSPSFTISKAYVEPLVSLAPPQVDVDLAIGVALLT